MKCGIVILLCLWYLPGPGATYYVDYDGGNDAQAGTSAVTAWQHAPGDPQATGLAAGAALAGGDAVLFKGGVVYRGGLVLPADGAEGNPLTYKGDGWGAQQAVIEGAELVPGPWAKCASAADCAGNPNWNAIYWCAYPFTYNFNTAFYEDDEFMWFAQDPNVTDPFFYDRYEEFRTVPLNDPSLSVTRTSVTDPRVFTQGDTAYWQGAYVTIYHNPNVVGTQAITGFDPAAHTISFDAIGNDPQAVDSTYRYTLLNHPALIDRPGEYAIDGRKIYIWPRRSGDPANHRYTILKRDVAVDFKARDHIVLEGFEIRKFNTGIQLHDWNLVSEDIVIRHNVIARTRGGTPFSTYNVDRLLFENNRIIEGQIGTGISIAGYQEDRSARVVIKNNLVQKVGYVGIWVREADYCQVVNNTVTGALGTHANAISVYQNSHRVLVAGNRVYDSWRSLTLQASDHITIYNNIFDNKYSGVYSWGSIQNVVMVNNLMFCGASYIPADSLVFKNNIVNAGDGASPMDRSHNIYVGLSWNQAPPGWNPATGEIVGPVDGSTYTGVDMSGTFRNAPRCDAAITSFNNATSLHIDDFYNPIVEAGDYLVIDQDTANVRTITATQVLYADGGNRRTRLTFTPAVDSLTGSLASVWKAAAGFTRDYMLKAGGPAVEAGIDVTSHLPVTDFPDFDFNADIAGNPRPNGAGWDIGPYEYTGNGIRQSMERLPVAVPLVVYMNPMTVTEAVGRLSSSGNLYNLAGKQLTVKNLKPAGVYLVGRDGKPARKVLLVK